LAEQNRKAECARVPTVSVNARNVGLARAIGAEALLKRGARWLAFIDADTLVSPSWLADQLSLDADAVCGTVGVDDWSPHGAHTKLLHWHFLQTYMDRDGHKHVHSANMSVSAEAYRRAGVFKSLACSGDHALVRALEATGVRLA
jgi:glycosyltransferase involved in cell wall biosynthesis